MTIAYRLAEDLTDLADVKPLLNQSNDGKVLVYDHSLHSFVMMPFTESSVRLASVEEAAFSDLMFVFDDGDTDSGEVEFVIGL